MRSIDDIANEVANRIDSEKKQGGMSEDRLNAIADSIVSDIENRKRGIKNAESFWDERGPSDDELIRRAREGQATSSIKKDETEPEEEPIGLLNEGARSFARGVNIGVPQAIGKGLQWMDPDGGTSAIAEAGKAIEIFGDRQEKKLTPIIKRSEEAETAPWYSARKIAAEGPESMATSVVPMITGLGTAAVAGPIAGSAAGLATLGTMFYGGSAETKYREAKGAGLSDDDAKELANWEGGIEAGGEIIADLIPLKLFGLAARPLKGQIIKSLTAKEPAKQIFKNIGKTILGEETTEIGQALGQTYANKQYGVDSGEYGENVADVIGPTLFMSLFFGGAGTAYNSSKRKQITQVLSDPKSDQKEFDAVLNEVGGAVHKVDPELAKRFVVRAHDLKRQGKPVVLNDDSFYSGPAGEVENENTDPNIMDWVEIDPATVPVKAPKKPKVTKTGKADLLKQNIDESEFVEEPPVDQPSAIQSAVAAEDQQEPEAAPVVGPEGELSEPTDGLFEVSIKGGTPEAPYRVVKDGKVISEHADLGDAEAITREANNKLNPEISAIMQAQGQGMQPETPAPVLPFENTVAIPEPAIDAEQPTNSAIGQILNDQAGADTQALPEKEPNKEDRLKNWPKSSFFNFMTRSFWDGLNDSEKQELWAEHEKNKVHEEESRQHQEKIPHFTLIKDQMKSGVVEFDSLMAALSQVKNYSTSQNSSARGNLEGSPNNIPALIIRRETERAEEKPATSRRLFKTAIEKGVSEDVLLKIFNTTEEGIKPEVIKSIPKDIPSHLLPVIQKIKQWRPGKESPNDITQEPAPTENVNPVAEPQPGTDAGITPVNPVQPVKETKRQKAEREYADLVNSLTVDQRRHVGADLLVDAPESPSGQRLKIITKLKSYQPKTEEPQIADQPGVETVTNPSLEAGSAIPKAKRPPVQVMTYQGDKFFVDPDGLENPDKKTVRMLTAKGELLSKNRGNSKIIHKSNLIDTNDQAAVAKATKISRSNFLTRKAEKQVLSQDEIAELVRLEKELFESARTENSTPGATGVPEMGTDRAPAGGTPVTPEANAQEPWQMPQLKFHTATRGTKIDGRVDTTGGKPKYVYSMTVKYGGEDRTFEIQTRGQLNGSQTVERLHKEIVKQALSEGRPVPPEVLKDYPDLQAKPAEAKGEAPKETGEKLTIDEYLNKVKGQIGRKDFESIKSGLIDQHYTDIEDHIKANGQITKQVFQSLEEGKRKHFIKKYGTKAIEGYEKAEPVSLLNGEKEKDEFVPTRESKSAPIRAEKVAAIRAAKAAGKPEKINYANEARKQWNDYIKRHMMAGTKMEGTLKEIVERVRKGYELDGYKIEGSYAIKGGTQEGEVKNKKQLDRDYYTTLKQEYFKKNGVAPSSVRDFQNGVESGEYKIDDLPSYKPAPQPAAKETKPPSTEPIKVYPGDLVEFKPPGGNLTEGEVRKVLPNGDVDVTAFGQTYDQRMKPEYITRITKENERPRRQEKVAEENRTKSTPKPAPQKEAAVRGETKTETDPARIQEIKNSIADGEMILKSGKTATGKKLTPGQLVAVQRSVDNSKAKIGGKTEPAKIDDFGEKIGGARKDKLPSIETEISDDDLSSQPLSKIWPKAELDAIEDTFTAALATAARSEIPAKPQLKNKVKRWVEKVKSMRELVKSAPTDGREKIIDGLKKSYYLKDLASKITLLESIDRQHWDRIGNVVEAPDAYRYNPSTTGGPMEKVSSPYVSVYIDGRYNSFNGAESVSDILDDIKAKLEGETKSDTALKFEIRGTERSGYFINKKGDSEYRQLKTFEKLDDAQAYRKDHYKDLVEAWEAVKERDNVKKTDVRGVENRPRVGKDHRNGKDVTPEMFSYAFGFRGVEFGNWVSQGKNTKERQGMLNLAYDALMDLSNILKIPPKALSLNGTLGLGFGSRGSGWASAHYEPGTLVINLTKPRGAGALAHEFFHALDHYFQRKRGATSNKREGMYITYRPETTYRFKDTNQTMPASWYNERLTSRSFKPEDWTKVEGVRPEVEEAFDELVKALNASPMAGRARSIKSEYWSRIIERAARSFENYVIAKMMEGGYHNDYLANVVAIEEFGRDKSRYPYLLQEELAPVVKAFDNLFDTIQTKETDKGVLLYQKNNIAQTPATDAWNRMALEVLQKAGSIETQFLNDAEFDSVLGQYLEIEGKQQSDEQEIAAFYSPMTDKIYIKKSAAKKDTFFHEQAHPVTMKIEKDNPQFYQQGLDLAEKSPYYQQAIDNGYKAGKEAKDEALVQAIGEKGAQIQDESLKNRFTAWLRKMYRQARRIFKKAFGIQITLDDYVTGIAYGMRSGKYRTGSNEGGVKFQKISDTGTINRLESGKKIKAFRAMQLIDGKLYPPMSAKINGELREPTDIGQWEKADENPEFAVGGKFKLDKANKSSITAAYNPYFHTSPSPLNDQFSSAYNRPNLVTVEVEIPASELTSGYKADGAKDSVGEKSWHTGPVSSKLSAGKKRTVILSRYAKVTRIVPDSEVAGIIAKTLEGENVVIPENVVTPSLKEELIKQGLPVVGKGADIRMQKTLQPDSDSGKTDTMTDKTGKGDISTGKNPDSLSGGVDFSTDPEWHDIAYRDPSKEALQRLKKWLKANPTATVKMYHGTDAAIPIETEGIKPTSRRTAKSLQSRHGVVSLSIYPGMAEAFGRMAYPGKEIAVYAVDIPVSRLIPDADQLRNKRMWGENQNIGGTLADSVAFGHGAQVKGTIWPYELTRINGNASAPGQVRDDIRFQKTAKKKADDLVDKAMKPGPDELMVDGVLVKLRKSKDMGKAERVIRPPQWIAKRFPKFAKMFERQQVREKERSKHMADTLKETHSLWSLNDDQQAELSTLIFSIENRKIKNIPHWLTPTASKAEVKAWFDQYAEENDIATDDVSQADMGKLYIEQNPDAGFTLNDAHYEAMGDWVREKGASEEVVQSFLEIRRSLDKDLVEVWNKLKVSPDIQRGEIAEYRSQILKVANYFPHKRYGNYSISIIDPKQKDPDTGKPKLLYYTHFDSKDLTMAMNARKELADIFAEHPEYRDYKISVGKVARLSEEVYETPIPVAAIEQILSAAAERIADPSTAAMFRDMLPEATADELKARGWASHAIHRNNVPGYETENLKRALFDYKSGLYGWLTKMDAAKDFSKMLAGADAKREPVLYGYMKQYAKDMLENSDDVDRLVGNMKAVFFAKYLGGNLKTAALNLSQNIIAGAPRLGMEIKGSAYAKWFEGAMKQIRNQISGSETSLNEDEARLLHELYDEGTTQANYTDEVMGQFSGGVKSAWDKVIGILGYPMLVAERFNRSSLALAAFKAAKAGQINNPKTLEALGLSEGQAATYEQAKIFAEGIVLDAHFAYGKGNRPEMFRGSAGAKIMSSAYTFRSFSHNLINLWEDMYRSGGRGRVAILQSIAGTVAIGGMASIPLYKTLMHVIRQATGDDWGEDGILGMIPEGADWLRDLIMYGLPSLLGVNMGGSVGMEFPVFEKIQINDSWVKQLSAGTFEFIGIPGAILKDAETALTHISAGRYGRGIEAILPAGLANILKGYRMHTEGQHTASGKPVVLPGEKEPRKIGTAKMVGQMLGFQPIEAAKGWDLNSKLSDFQAFKTGKQGEFADRMAAAKKAKDREQIKAIGREVADWNKKQREEGRFEYIVDIERAVKARMEGRQPPKYLKRRAMEMKGRMFEE